MTVTIAGDSLTFAQLYDVAFRGAAVEVTP